MLLSLLLFEVALANFKFGYRFVYEWVFFFFFFCVFVLIRRFFSAGWKFSRPYPIRASFSVCWWVYYFFYSINRCLDITQWARCRSIRTWNAQRSMDCRKCSFAGLESIQLSLKIAFGRIATNTGKWSNANMPKMVKSFFSIWINQKKKNIVGSDEIIKNKVSLLLKKWQFGFKQQKTAHC